MGLYNFLLQNWPDKKLNLTKNHVTELRTCSSGQDASSLLPSLLSLSLSPWRLFSLDRLLRGQVYQHGSPSLFSSSSCPLLVCLRVCRLLSSLLPKSRPRTVVTTSGLR